MIVFDVQFQQRELVLSEIYNSFRGMRREMQQIEWPINVRRCFAVNVASSHDNSFVLYFKI